MKRFVLTESAKADLDAIWFYIAQDSGSIERAERVIWKLHKRILALAASPGIGRACPDIDPEGRCSPMDNYVIYYRELSRRIVITHVFHSKREQVKAWKTRSKR